MAHGCTRRRCKKFVWKEFATGLDVVAPYVSSRDQQPLVTAVSPDGRAMAAILVRKGPRSARD